MLPWRRSPRDHSPPGEDELSPLDCIRQAEAEVTRRIVASREAAERSIANSRAETQSIKEQARLAGRQEGQSKYAEIVKKADADAGALVAKAWGRVEQLFNDGNRRMDAAVQLVLDLILEEKK